MKLNNFFRKDLNLKSRWWHRLLMVFYAGLFALFTFYMLSVGFDMDIFRGGDVQKWKNVSFLSERIGRQIKPIGDLLREGEKISENDRTYFLNNDPDPYYNGVINDVYCLNNISKDYEKVKILRSTEDLYVGGAFSRNKVSHNNFVDYILKNNILCVSVDAFTRYNDNGQSIGKLRFLSADISYQDNWSFFKKDTFSTAVYLIEMILAVVAGSLFLFAFGLLVYYKIIIYILFGNNESVDSD
jgi:hypothetical protein